MSSNPLHTRRTDGKTDTDPKDGLNDPAEDKYHTGARRKGTSAQTPWQLYNEKARIYDREMVKEWEDNLSILLVFAALFSAVLTAFIIASMPLLQENSQDSTQQILLTISQQLQHLSQLSQQSAPVNATIPASSLVAFTAPAWAVRVNVLFFLSLGFSLFAALAGVLALQWIRDYDIGLAQITEPRERALRRHFRFEGMEKWRMPEIIAILPTFLPLALLLFLGGLVEWLLHINATVAATMLAILSMSIIFYTFTQLSAAVYPSSPFRSPISRLAEDIVIKVRMRALIITQKKLERSGERPILPLDDISASTSFTALSRIREKSVINEDITLPSSALTWLLNHVEMSESHLHNIIDTLVQFLQTEIPSTVANQSLTTRAPWSTIIEWIAAILYRQRDNLSGSHTFTQAIVLAEICAIVGVKHLRPFTRLLFQTTPSMQPGRMSLTHRQIVRFALWRGGSPQQEDSTNPPLNLFSSICCDTLSSGLLTACLKEMKGLLHNQTLSPDEAIAFLSNLLERNQSSSMHSILDKHEMRAEVLSVAHTALCQMSTPLRGRPRLASDSDKILRLFYIYQWNVSFQWPLGDVDLFFQAFFSQLIVHSASLPDFNSRIRSFGLLVHITSLPFWRKTLRWRDGHPQTIYRGLIKNVVRQLNPAVRNVIPGHDLYPTTRVLESAIAVLYTAMALPPNLAHGTIERELLLQALTFQAISIEAANTNFAIQPVPPRHETMNPVSWVHWIYSRYQMAMKEENFAIFVSIIFGYICKEFHVTLYYIQDEDSVSKIASITNPALRLMASTLLGWDYAPRNDDVIWESISWKLATIAWCIDSSLEADAPCSAMILAMSQRRDAFYEDLFFSYLHRRVHKIVDDQVEDRGDVAVEGIFSLLTATLPAFTYMHHQRWRLAEAISALAICGGFLPIFLRLGGLEWLVTFIRPTGDIDENDHKERGKSSLSILLNFFNKSTTQFDDPRTLLKSPVLRDISDNLDVQSYINLVRTVYTNFFDRFGKSEGFSGVAHCCGQILNHSLLEAEIESSIPISIDELEQKKSWHEEIRRLIKRLRGE